MKTEFDMSSSKHRAIFLFAVSNLTRWITLVTQQLPGIQDAAVTEALAKGCTCGSYSPKWQVRIHVQSDMFMSIGIEGCSG